MCVLCAAITATAAVGAKWNADQLQKPEEQRKPILKVSGLVIVLLIAGSITYHTLNWQN
jgi:hypothetical protein